MHYDVVERMLWFKFALDPEMKYLSRDDVHSLIRAYISRNDEEIDTLHLKRKTSQHPIKCARLEMLEFVKEKDNREYETGFSVPDLENASNVKTLREWNGDWNSKKLLKMTRICKSTVAA
jgi:translation machinery-associated protein 16